MTDLSINKKPVHFVQLDALRFLAAFMVIIVHAFDAWSGWFGIPWRLATPDRKSWSWIGNHIHNFVSNFGFGVDLFFLISGFLITYLLIREKSEKSKVNIPAFFLRRILRIWPLYFFVIGICYFWYAPWMGWGHEPGHPIDYKSAMLFYNNFATIKTQTWEFPFAHFWSICIEEHFYLVWPFLVAFIPMKKLPHVLITIIIGSMLFRLHAFMTMPESFFTLYLHTLSRIDALAFGGLAAWAHYHRPAAWNIPRYIRFLLFAVLIFSMTFDNMNDWSTPFLVMWKKYFYLALAGFLMMNFVFNPDCIIKLGPKNILNYLGRCCFGIYLWGNILLQILLHKIILKHFPGGNGWAFWGIVLFFSLAVPVISYEFIEKPFMKLKNRFAIIRTRM